MSTIGYGDVSATTEAEMIYCIVLGIICSGMFGYIMN